MTIGLPGGEHQLYNHDFTNAFRTSQVCKLFKKGPLRLWQAAELRPHTLGAKGNNLVPSLASTRNQDPAYFTDRLNRIKKTRDHYRANLK